MIMKNSLNEADCCYEAYKPEAISLFFLFRSLFLSLSLNRTRSSADAKSRRTRCKFEDEWKLRVPCGTVNFIKLKLAEKNFGYTSRIIMLCNKSYKEFCFLHSFCVLLSLKFVFSARCAVFSLFPFLPIQLHVFFFSLPERKSLPQFL